MPAPPGSIASLLDLDKTLSKSKFTMAPVDHADRIEFATSDAEMKHRLATSAWLSGKDYRYPSWLNDAPDILADPALITSVRLEALRDGSLPKTESERRFVRNMVVMKQISKMMAKRDILRSTELQAAGAPGSRAVAKDAQTQFCSPNKQTTLPEPEQEPRRPLSSTLTGTMPLLTPLTEHRRMSIPPVLENRPEGLALSANAVSCAARSAPGTPSRSIRPAEMPSLSKNLGSNDQHVENLNGSQLAPLSQRLQYDKDEILRLRGVNATIAKENERHRTELKDLQQKHSRAPQAEAPTLKHKRSTPQVIALDENAHNLDEHSEAGQLLQLASEISKALADPVPNETIHLCGLGPLKIMEARPDEVLQLAEDKLHTWPYSIVPLQWRRLYEDASLSKVVLRLSNHVFAVAEKEKEQKQSTAAAVKKRKVEFGMAGLADPSSLQSGAAIAAPTQEQPIASESKEWLADVVHTLDKGIMLSGAPGRNAIFEEVFQKLESHIATDSQPDLPKQWPIFRPYRFGISTSITHVPGPLAFDLFQVHLESKTTPLIIPGTLKVWPALERWQSPEYFMRATLGGRRLVPVEVGKSYTDDEWGQKILTFGEFVDQHLLAKEPKDIGYLAQHDLFDQIPALKKDIITPDYCYSTPPEPDAVTSRTPGLKAAPRLNEPLLNAWIGPKGTKTPLHTDPYHNILCQVVGYKYVRLYPPSESANLYPLSMDDTGVNMENTSSINVDLVRTKNNPMEADIAELKVLKKDFPKFLDAEFVEAVLEPGECLYIPLGWWHYVESLSISASVSFWWN